MTRRYSDAVNVTVVVDEDGAHIRVIRDRNSYAESGVVESRDHLNATPASLRRIDKWFRAKKEAGSHAHEHFFDGGDTLTKEYFVLTKGLL